jgi:hypothetical protein
MKILKMPILILMLLSPSALLAVDFGANMEQDHVANIDNADLATADEQMNVDNNDLNLEEGATDSWYGYGYGYGYYPYYYGYSSFYPYYGYGYGYGYPYYRYWW